MLSSSQSHMVITNYCRNGETAVRQRPRISGMNEINNRSRNQASPVGIGLIWSWAGGWDRLQRWAEIARVSVRQMPDGQLLSCY